MKGQPLARCDHHAGWVTKLCPGKWHEAANANRFLGTLQHCPPQGGCSPQLCTAPYLISDLVTRMNASSMSNECFIKPAGQALIMYFSSLIGTMLQSIIDLPPHSIRSASKKQF